MLKESSLWERSHEGTLKKKKILVSYSLFCLMEVNSLIHPSEYNYDQGYPKIVFSASMSINYTFSLL